MILHPSWAPHRAITLRWGCKEPNLQNFPENMRDLIMAREGMWFAQADYSALELRLIALLSGDPLLLDWYDKGIDPHIENAKLVGMTRGLKIERDIAKTECYAFSYNQSENVETVWKASVVKLSEDYPEIATVLTLPRMQIHRKRFFEAHPAIKQWQLTQVAEAEKNKYVEAPLSGRRRYYHDGHVNPNEVLNYPMQSSGATLTNRALLSLDKEIRWNNGEAILAQVHDSILLEGPDPLRLASLLKTHMEQTVTLNGRAMKFPVDLGIGKDWLNLLKVKDISQWSVFLSSLDWSSSPAASVPM